MYPVHTHIYGITLEPKLTLAKLPFLSGNPLLSFPISFEDAPNPNLARKGEISQNQMPL